MDTFEIRIRVTVAERNLMEPAGLGTIALGADLRNMIASTARGRTGHESVDILSVDLIPQET
jgi:hypothetical protein